MKLKLGDTLLLRCFTKSYASFSDHKFFCIRYATVTVTDRLIPARQWTNTPQFLDRASSVEKMRR